MEKLIKDYKVLKTATNNENTKSISIIEIENKKYILKRVNDNFNDKLINMLKNEVNILYKLKDLEVSPNLFYYSFENNNNFIIIELIKGKSINKLKLDTLKLKISLMLRIIDAVKKIHDLGVIHCDLKPDNILLDVNKNIKIIDYGISVENNKNYFKGYGSVKYCSKMQLTTGSVDKYVDLYSLGIIFYELICGKLPFNGTKEEIIFKKRNNLYEKTDNDYFNMIFSKIFDDTNPYKYKSLDEFEIDLHKIYN